LSAAPLPHRSPTDRLDDGPVSGAALSRTAPAPLSFAQLRMWFFGQLEPESSLYNSSRVYRLHGALDASVLERSFAEVVRRHEILRTRFRATRGGVIQEVAVAEPFHLRVVDLTALPLDEREAESQRRVVAESRQPFDLATGPLFRVLLLRLTPVEHQLMVVIHHIATDAWSARLLLRELITLYRAYLAGEPSSLADPPIQYRDYSWWQHEQARGEAFGRDLAFWKGRLKDMPPVLELPTLRARPETDDVQVQRLSFEISADSTAALAALGRQERATLFMTLLAAFKVVLWRYTGQTDLVVGVPVAGRTRVELEDALGCFTNTLVLRTDLAGEPSFREVLRRVRAVTVGGYAHQEFPFERLVEELRPERSIHHHPLFQVMFNFRDFPGWTSDDAGLGIEEVEVPRNHALVDLALRIVRRDSRLSAQVVCHPRFFDAAAAERLVQHYRLVLQSVISNPEQNVSSLSLLTPAERQQQLVEWNATARDYPAGRGVHQLVEAQVARTPNAPAVVCGDVELTYAGLNGRANQVAAALRSLGVGPGAYVPLLMPGGIEVAIGMLAVMKAGAAFVPLDLDWPVERIRAALSQLPTGVALVSSDLPFRATLLDRPVLVVDFSADGDVAARHFEPTAEVATPAEAPIYAIFTSGSTGVPKAAVVPHRGITNRLLWMNDFFGPATAAAVLQTTRHVYDSAVWQLFWPLINGGKTVLPGPGADGSAEALARLIERQQVTITDFVPSVFNVLVPEVVAAAPLRHQLRSLRAIIVGGEEITPATTYQFMATFPDVRVINLYGPTEASIGCICYEVTGTEGDSIPIGRPIANVQVLVLDQNRNPVPVGVAGELYLGGTCVGLGYLSDAEKTGASFLHVECPELRGGKLYRTGDRVRYRPDGNLEFLGRMDRQVKLRGLRIELGEIESALNRHPSVRESLAMVREDSPGDKRLVGYVVPDDDNVPSVSELRDFLRRTLPTYMTPAHFVLLSEVPRSPGGKVYRGALPRPDYTSPAIDEIVVEPRTTTEVAIARIWAEVLQLDRVGVHANFFDLGGHSLMATRLISRVRAELQVELPLRTLFEAPTVAGLASEITRRDEQAQADQALLLQELEGLSEDDAQRLLLGELREGGN
jgi:amino acid adenylation domain-containing protein